MVAQEIPAEVVMDLVETPEDLVHLETLKATPTVQSVQVAHDVLCESLLVDGASLLRLDEVQLMQTDDLGMEMDAASELRLERPCVVNARLVDAAPLLRLERPYVINARLMDAAPPLFRPDELGFRLDAGMETHLGKSYVATA